ncbi:alpha-L-fucosidase [Flavobacterium rhamnosiphilum]|uniref:alpha-L-fucosidase n=1 Tax=Flavobacterium rhamnosiphilum TaxID=2541724 RepID=A0A4R5F8C2_9FLAO|nr:alpha-L-fucosidase [Flavobacterium rhamnosiphilum]TDE44334.1 alpha-L-fucosidase [Flavobacterium rhamnosiphilum]
MSTKTKNRAAKYLLLIVFIATICLPAKSFSQEKTKISLQYGSHREGKRTDADMARWRGYGLGQFIHWGVYAIPGGHWDGKYYGGAAEWIRSWEGMPNAEYDKLYKQFNPVNFSAAAWAKQAKNMGAKYVIITTKHHDGFCIWPSKYTDYNIKNTPYKKDILKEIVTAYDKEGIDVYLYFSIIDWNHPGYQAGTGITPEDRLNWSNYKPFKTDEEKTRYATFKEFTRNQLIELLTDYPTAKGLWFDGTWDGAWMKEFAWVDQLEKELRAMRPGLIIGSRFRADENGKRGFDSNGVLMGDYEQGWERDLPNSIEDVHGNDWDCVMTVPENQWGYHSDWRGYVKTSDDLIEMLVKSVSMNGNFVLNFGPDGKGAIRPEETKLAKEIGDWMKINNEAIYGCTYVNLKKQGWGYYTKKDNKIYLTVINRPINERVNIEIPKGGLKPIKAYLLENKKTADIINRGRNKQNSSLYSIAIPTEYKSNKPFVIVLEVGGTEEIKEAYQQAKT